MNSIDYFKNRGIDPNFYKNYKIPAYILKNIPTDKNIKILEIGCGFGQLILALKNLGYMDIQGIDIDPFAVNSCLKKNLAVELTQDLLKYDPNGEKFNLIIMSHVLEHMKKNEIIPTLSYIKKRLLKDSGELFLMVPNGQSNTGCYWAYEDFTHNTLFTAGSIFYVLKSAGFEKINFVDINCLDGFNIFIKIIRISFLKLFKIRYFFWNAITGSSFHKPSPTIFSYEIKVKAN
jgi:SAM-dependent methyltransferase